MAKNKKPIKLGDTLKKFTKEFILNEAKKERDKAYSFRRIFEQMELDLISSMNKALYFHENEELKEGFRFEQWQLVKLRAMEKYRRRNKAILGEYKPAIENVINETLQQSFDKGIANVEKQVEAAKNVATGEIKLPQDEITEEVINSRKPQKIIPEQKGIEDVEPNKVKTPKSIEELPKAPREESFFGVNEKKLDALQKTVNNDLDKASQAVLRKMDDVYRQTIFKTHVYFQNGTKTLNQAIDMATKDFLEKGINCIEYKNGARVNIASYAEMALRTASHRATLLGEGKKRDEWGLHLVVVSAHANTCKHCEPWQGKILIDDVFSHPSKEYLEENKKYPLLSEAIEKKLLHPNCRHTLTTYFPGITKLPVVPDGDAAIKLYEAEQKQRALERELRKWKRAEAGACDLENQEKAHKEVKSLENRLKEHLKNNPQLRRDYYREEPGQGITNKTLKANAERLKQKALDGKIEETRKYIKSDEWPKEILEGKQGKHILGHNNYIEGRSYLTISLEEAQELVNKYSGTGEVRFNSNDEWDKKEIIKVDEDIGVDVNNKTGEETSTNRFKIHYSDKGTHIVPMRRE